MLVGNLCTLKNSYTFARSVLQLFKGTFYYCKGPTVRNIKNKTQCLMDDKKNVWINQKYNFDDLGQVFNIFFKLLR